MPMIPCVPCRRFFKVKTVGVRFEEGMPTADGWRSYKVWAGDLYECEGCGAQIVCGVPMQPLAEHYQPDYAAALARSHPVCRVDDCCGAFSEDKAAALRGRT